MEQEIKVIIPVYNEAESISYVLSNIPNFVDEIIVVNNNSSDDTVNIVSKYPKTTVLFEPIRGYGSACLKGVKYLKENNFSGIVVFMDGDFSDDPKQMSLLLDPIFSDKIDMVIGSRVMYGKKDSMTKVQRFGNTLACKLIRWFHGYTYTDLGPFRAIKYSALSKMNMKDTTFGWTIEMQIKALLLGINIKEISVSYNKRIAGKSKISGDIKAVFLAGIKIIYTILKYRKL